MSNEAAERLREYAAAGVDGWLRAPLYLIEDALATERKATVERIRAALDADSWYGKAATPRGHLNAILDAEAER